MAKILIITDTPIEREINTTSHGIVNTMSTQVDVTYVGLHDVNSGWVNKLKGQRADIVLVPETLKAMPEIHGPLRDSLIAVVQGMSSKIVYYENSY